jgi:hypothetical protein
LDPICREKNRRINKMYKKTLVYFARFMNYYHEGKIKETDKGGTRSMIGDMTDASKVRSQSQRRREKLREQCTDRRVILKHILYKSELV